MDCHPFLPFVPYGQAGRSSQGMATACSIFNVTVSNLKQFTKQIILN